MAAGDFDGDRDPDGLWRHSTSGRLAVWLLDELVRAGGGLLTPDVPAGAGWEPAGVNAADNDASADLLWREAPRAP